jgi:hypothetical protein
LRLGLLFDHGGAEILESIFRDDDVPPIIIIISGCILKELKNDSDVNTPSIFAL